MKLWISALCLGLSSVCFADDNPQVDLGADQYDAAMCINQYTQNCITNICTVSDNIDCQSKCSAEAKDKCAEQQDD